MKSNQLKVWSVVAVAFNSVGVVWAGPHGTFSAREALKNEQAISDQMTELSIDLEPAPDFDAELTRLSSRERQFREKLPALSNHPRLKSVVARVSGQRYREKRN